ncbi:MAG: hypothetical protein MJB14_18345 [Spirochaetes bacterium]|nr:hypothetical protein [Spirochaetota bacterium]
MKQCWLISIFFFSSFHLFSTDYYFFWDKIQPDRFNQLTIEKGTKIIQGNFEIIGYDYDEQPINLFQTNAQGDEQLLNCYFYITHSIYRLEILQDQKVIKEIDIPPAIIETAFFKDRWLFIGASVTFSQEKKQVIFHQAKPQDMVFTYIEKTQKQLPILVLIMLIGYYIILFGTSLFIQSDHSLKVIVQIPTMNLIIIFFSLVILLVFIFYPQEDKLFQFGFTSETDSRVREFQITENENQTDYQQIILLENNLIEQQKKNLKTEDIDKKPEVVEENLIKQNGNYTTLYFLQIYRQNGYIPLAFFQPYSLIRFKKIPQVRLENHQYFVYFPKSIQCWCWT